MKRKKVILLVFIVLTVACVILLYTSIRDKYNDNIVDIKLPTSFNVNESVQTGPCTTLILDYAFDAEGNILKNKKNKRVERIYYYNSENPEIAMLTYSNDDLSEVIKLLLQNSGHSFVVKLGTDVSYETITTIIDLINLCEIKRYTLNQTDYNDTLLLRQFEHENNIKIIK